jgi:hypothetical protein
MSSTQFVSFTANLPLSGFGIVGEPKVAIDIVVYMAGSGSMAIQGL